MFDLFTLLGVTPKARTDSKIDAQTKVSVANRVVAKIMDLFLVMAVSVILPYPFGPLIGFAYSLFADGIRYKEFQGQSLGKKVMKLQVVRRSADGQPGGVRQPANFKDSALRNAPVGVATFFAIIPVWGWLILALVGLPLMIMEIYLMLSVENHRRLGDVMGDTEVIHLPESA